VQDLDKLNLQGQGPEPTRADPTRRGLDSAVSHVPYEKVQEVLRSRRRWPATEQLQGRHRRGVTYRIVPIDPTAPHRPVASQTGAARADRSTRSDPDRPADRPSGHADRPDRPSPAAPGPHLRVEWDSPTGEQLHGVQHSAVRAVGLLCLTFASRV
jgi:hypothetical protein